MLIITDGNDRFAVHNASVDDKNAVSKLIAVQSIDIHELVDWKPYVDFSGLTSRSSYGFYL